MRRHKYGAKPTYRCLPCGAQPIDPAICHSCGSREIQFFASSVEGRRYDALRLMERAGVISGLELQPRFPFTVAGIRVGEYRADFRYIDRERGEIVEDVKGYETPEFKLKHKLMGALYPGVRLEIVKR